MAAADAAVPERISRRSGRRHDADPRHSRRSTSAWFVTRTDRSHLNWSSCRHLRRCTVSSSPSPKRIAMRSACPPRSIFISTTWRPIATTRSPHEAIVGDHDPAEVVLMEIQPRQQKTWPDFVVTEQKWGVRAVDTTEVTREGRRLYLPARWQGHADQAHLQPRHSRRARTQGHPVALRIRRRPRGAVGRASGMVFPLEQVLDSVAQAPIGSGNAFPRRHRTTAGRSRAVSAEAALLIRGRRHHVRAQPTRRSPPSRARSARTTSCRSGSPSRRSIETPEGPTQVEIRIMYVRDPSTSLGAGGARLRPVLPLLRMGRGKMMGVDHNKGLRWVGASAGLISPQH